MSPLPGQKDLTIDPISRASTIPAKWYVDPGMFDVEIDRVFGRTWQLVGRTDQLREPGAYFTCEVAREPLIVARGSDDVIRAFSNVCRHRGGPVARGEGVLKSFHCAYHGWSYNLDGSLRLAPDLGAIEAFEKSRVLLPQVRVEIVPPFIFVNLDRAAPSLNEVVGDFPNQLRRYDPAKLRLVAKRSYEVSCNWKVLLDNFLECYHCRLIHPNTVAANVDLDGYVVESSPWYSRHYFASTHPDRLRPRAENLRGDPESQKSRADAQHRYTYCFFPNFAISLLPGWLVTFRAVPVEIDRTIVLRDFMSEDHEKSTAELERDSALTYYEKVFAEDVEMVQLVQRQLRSKLYSAGRYSVRHEQGVYHFHSVLKRMLAGETAC